ncbi:MAG: dihydroorotate dehydrogenase electron transfer subunit [Ruminococcaceae bacterium]|nr:dihydroorotate dehydrogenase electron transfer subunit [Oscillospiraceae bacterium]
MMKQGIYQISENKPLTSDIFLMRLSGDTSALTRPGQFVNIALEGMFLRRPISVCDYKEGELTIIYKVVGKGTEAMSKMSEGKELDLLCGLGNGFDPDKCGDEPVVIGGGVGVPPMYGTAKALIEKGKKVTAILGFNTAKEIFYKEEFEALGCDVKITTVDGSAGIKGFVTNALEETDFSDYCACGPEPMLKALYNATDKKGQLSFEERMGCGFGACMGCSCKTIYGNKRICKEGPVLDSDEILWDKEGK